MLALDSSVSSDLKNDKLFLDRKPISPASYSQTAALPRLNLRKRSYVLTNKSSVNLTAVTSAFLSGLFADVAATQSDSIDDNRNLPQQLNTEANVISDEDSVLNSNVSNKRSRVNLRSLARGKSVKAFDSLATRCTSPKQANTPYFDESSGIKAQRLNHCDSLLFQLSCVSDPSGTDYSTAEPAHIPRLVFPDLPNAVSVSSCSSSLTRNLSDLHASLTEVHGEKEGGYGWFVEMDDDDNRLQVDAYAVATASKLAFCAPTAPKGNNCEAEIEWATAADTVDDVLGDFF